MSHKICVFCSSSDNIPVVYRKIAANLGKIMAEKNDILVFGGTSKGLMGSIANAMHEGKGKIFGVIPSYMKSHTNYEFCDEYIFAEDPRIRKFKLDQLSDAFIALPGGFGTLDEIFELINMKMHGFHNKPIIFININSFFNNLKLHLEKIFAESFAKSEKKDLFYFAKNELDAYKYLENNFALYRASKFSKE